MQVPNIQAEPCVLAQQRALAQVVGPVSPMFEFLPLVLMVLASIPAHHWS